MRVFADASGVILRAQSGVEPGAPPVTPMPPIEGVITQTLDFDDESNQALVADLQASTAPYRLTAGVLTKNGAAVTIAGPGRTLRDKQFAMEKLAELEADRDLTINQIGRVLRFVLRWIVRHG
jgi:hypothetical protein